MTDQRDQRGGAGGDRRHRRLRHARPRGRLRRAPPAGRGADRRLRALRVLPAHVPDVRALGRGDGLPARPHLPDEGGPRGRADDRLDGLALRRLPRLHGLRDRVPVRRAVRHPDRADPGPGRAQLRPLEEGQGAARAGVLAVPAPAPAAAAAWPAPAAAGQWSRPRDAAHRTARPDGAAARRDGAARAAARQAERLPEHIAASGPRRAVVGLLTGCVQGAFFPGVNAATARVLQAEGCDVVIPRTQGCCGALSVHNGREAEGQDYARDLVDTFEQTGVEYVVVNSAGCGSTMKEYAALLADDPAYADAREAFRRPRPRRLGDPRRARPGRDRGTRSRCRSPTTTPATSATPRVSAPSPVGCSRPSPAWSSGRSPRASCAAARPGSTTSSTPSRPRSSATARPRTSSTPGRRCWSPPTPAA